MVCQSCGQRPATVHILKTINSHKEEQHLCEVCAREQGQANLDAPFGFPNFSVQNVLASLLDQEAVLRGLPGTVEETRCGSCGTTFRQFRERGFFGCGRCYDAFEQELNPLLRRIQGSESHQGKAPKHAEGSARLKAKMAQLRRDLQAAIAKEQYEKAARIHERIKELERQQAGGGDAVAVE